MYGIIHHTQHHGVSTPQAAAARIAIGIANVALIAATACLLVAYLAFVNRATTKGFELRGMERRIGDLGIRNEQMDFETLAGQSMETVESQVGALGLVPVTSIEYLESASGEVAVR